MNCKSESRKRKEVFLTVQGGGEISKEWETETNFTVLKIKFSFNYVYFKKVVKSEIQLVYFIKE